MCVRPAAREAAVGCVTLGAMFAASRDARPGAGPACRGTAQPARTGPAAGQAGLRAPQPGGEEARAGRGLLQPGFAVGAGPTEDKVGGARKGLRLQEGEELRGLERARPGAREAGEGRAGRRRWRNTAPLEAKFEKKNVVPAIFQA